jgi:hypothetical protein
MLFVLRWMTGSVSANAASRWSEGNGADDKSVPANASPLSEGDDVDGKLTGEEFTGTQETGGELTGTQETGGELTAGGSEGPCDGT